MRMRCARLSLITKENLLSEYWDEIIVPWKRSMRGELTIKALCEPDTNDPSLWSSPHS